MQISEGGRREQQDGAECRAASVERVGERVARLGGGERGWGGECGEGRMGGSGIGGGGVGRGWVRGDGIECRSATRADRVDAEHVGVGVERDWSAVGWCGREQVSGGDIGGARRVCECVAVVRWRASVERGDEQRACVGGRNEVAPGAERGGAWDVAEQRGGARRAERVEGDRMGIGE